MMMASKQKITPFLWFDNQAEEAANKIAKSYASHAPDEKD
jgi:predicted 3-demethylubiquinone-9 3-methyltransferase (glyoxalase superfamily)